MFNEIIGVFTNSLSFLCWISMVTIVTHSNLATGISCYTCNSRNFTNRACHDPFHPVNITYTEHCKTPKVTHVGLFPASFCVKLKGLNAVTNEELVIRTCTSENMNNQCGIFKFEKETLTGCIVTCETDGCNRGSSMLLDYITICTILLVFHCLFNVIYTDYRLTIHM
ncbi:hypothetical protein B4U79_09137 [Dinothrombium tinctorium]|uniref:Uncharacterized protein n=1 Tax=Dinothrombium tinctorium TaxID=1965070 RepID=A0A3S3PPV4_9ACAR|nr:hypothetical protein B4U79_09137 [Dinothrombium tinctorium]